MIDTDRALLGATRPLPLPDDAALDEALADAQISTLLMCYVHLSHDTGMLDRFAPHLKQVILQTPEDIPAELANELRARAKAILIGAVAAAGGEPSAELYRRMMEVGVGDRVDDEFVPLLYDQIGLRPDRPRLERPDREPRPPLRIMVIGLGLAGIVTAIRLRQAGYDPVIIDKNPDVGGTWLLNTYPGVGVDTSSHFYSFSFAQWPHWTHFKPKGDEMYHYFRAVAEHYGLIDVTRFSTAVAGATYEEGTQTWAVRLRLPDGTTATEDVDVLINAGGFVHRARIPDIPGLDDFAGPKVHTARWDRSLDVRGKRVAVIGTGASGVQVVPELAGVACHVDVFMRARHWVLNNRETDVAISPGMKYAIERFPHFLEWWRFRIYWVIGDGQYVNIVKDPAWEGNMLATSPVNERMRQFAIAQMKEGLADRPDLYERVLPDFPIFSKRIISHPSWWDTLKRDDVDLVDTGIERIVPEGIVTTDGALHPCDVIVLATGFHVARMNGDLDLRGDDGHTLVDDWGDEDPYGYLGVTVPHFPNYFHMAGPNSAPNFAGGANIIAECQANYIVECLDWMLANGARAMAPTEVASKQFHERVAEQLTHTIWSHPRSKSYYQNRAGRNYMSWPFRMVDYWNETRAPKGEDYTLSGARPAVAAGHSVSPTRKGT